MILSVIGIAVGTGNIWRFSRVVAKNDGGTFLIPWVLFLFLWSIPLIIAEMAIGKFTRKSLIGSFYKMAGKKFAWMGAFVGFVTTAIMFYYSVVAGWCLRYLFDSVRGVLPKVQDYSGYWTSYINSYMPLVFHLVAMLIGMLIIYKGVVRGIEKTNRVLIPLILAILVILGIRAITLPGALKGLEYLFSPNFKNLLNPEIWLSALAQNAWDTGAGWGLILVYSAYMRKKEDMVLNACITGFSNNAISLLAGIIIFSTIFAIAPGQIDSIISGTGSTNEGLAFIFLPKLFQQMSFGGFFQIIFFLALSMAAITSLISMIELVVSNFVDLGVKRKSAILITGGFGFLFGIPSSLSLNFFNNQDWTWGIALILSGFFFAFSLKKFGVEEFRKKVINGKGNDLHVGKWYSIFITFIIPVEALILIVWWFFKATTWDSKWWHPLHTLSVGTCILQIALAIGFFLLLNKFLVKKIIMNEKKVR